MVGIDIGSTTTKIAALLPESGEMVYSAYVRHRAQQVKTAGDMLEKLREAYPEASLKLCLTGSGARPLADRLGASFLQEVVANSVSLKNMYEDVGTAIELGGQDAKIIFFGRDSGTGELTVYDMRMNGSCAGGTGAFIDEIAGILKAPPEGFESLAAKGRSVYDISGRCGVYAKTDIQPLLNQGVSREDLALSAFHAIAKQTIGGLAQGLTIRKPVVFEGGPLTFNPTLVRVFQERLQLSPEETLIPDRPEMMIARGAALSLREEREGQEQASREYSFEELLQRIRRIQKEPEKRQAGESRRFFASRKEREAFEARHALPEEISREPEPGKITRAYLGIDSGSTTTKMVLMDEEGNLLDSFYGHNEGSPLTVAVRALTQMRKRYRQAGGDLEIIAAGATGYGELLFAKAFSTECHVVETVAHARAAADYVKDVSFILDIGGQDMKAIWLDHGIITNILVNEACSSGCGSFLENFAANLGIPVKEIAQAAFSAENPADLGSRCTVFMNSSVITEQRNGKTPEDIMAGLCRSIIENVFTKVIRIPSMESLGERIVVQGGTFQNDAVLRAMEQYTGREVTRAPYPGLMGAIGTALITRERFQQGEGASTFIGLDAVERFTVTQTANAPCPHCGNHCKRTIVTFPNGKQWITNNRCERGGAQDEMKGKKAKNLFRRRQQLLFQDYPYTLADSEKGITIGLPRVLSFWEDMPFWKTFFRALGFGVKLSDFSTRKVYESGLPAVTSDTVCFPAKLVHGHLRNLASKGVDRIFMPSVTTVPSENREETSQSMCAIVKGYPIVVRNSDNPRDNFQIPFDAPLFHWYSAQDRENQLSRYMEESFGIPKKKTLEAIRQGDAAQAAFHRELQEEGKRLLEEVERDGSYAVVLAARPYQNDSLVNHDLPELFAGYGIPVLTADSLPGLTETDISRSRLDIVNNYHARMLEAAVIAAENSHLEYVQISSFGCGHDAYLSDEIIRMMGEISGKVPLVLKLDESDIKGPLGIRVRSFLETVNMRRIRGEQARSRALPDPYPVKFTKECAKEKIVLIPNTSHAFCRIMAAAFKAQGIRTVPLEIGRERAIRLGKQYVHNDICFPAQIVIGEILAALRSGKYDVDQVAVGMAKYVGDCRLTHYSALLRKALDDAGYSQVPILTNDDEDSHNLHPGFKMNLLTSLRIAFALPMIDALEELLRKIRPYELQEGAADTAFEKAMDQVAEGLEKGGVLGARKGFSRAVQIMREVPYDRSHPRPRVLIVGEYLLNFHPGANNDIEKYLEGRGFEIVEARMTDVIRKTYFYQDAQIREYGLKRPVDKKAWYRTANGVFNLAHDMTDRIAAGHPLYERPSRMQDLVKDSDPIIHHTFDAGEGVLIPGEILHHAKKGCRTFVILQPFGCLPNHVVGRGITKRLKELYPDVQILALDYDPDTSFANIENRLQMLECRQERDVGKRGGAYASPVSGSVSSRPASASSPAAQSWDWALKSSSRA